ncbi:MAG: glutamate mutase L [Planctomycetes bacterium]|nr:glutamate mutase L [Planctomycetota bacterium]
MALPAASSIDPQSLRAVLATDCGSTTTKAVLFERTPGGWRQTHRGEAPTTVEAPFEDVTVGARNAVTEVEELSGRRLLAGDDRGVGSLRFRRPASDSDGIDLYVSTSSAGGGLQMIVAGVVRSMTAESAQRAALGAGAIVMDVVSIDDERRPHERVARVRHLRPDIVLLSGGVDGGTESHVIELAEILLSADPRPRFGTTLRLPVVYAGNRNAAEPVGKLLADRFGYRVVENLRPVLERENLGPAREAIHEVFLSHVMSHAPGYDQLMASTSVEILPTPHAVGLMTQAAARQRGTDLLAVDIGGATTDVFSVCAGVFNRTVSANLGMSYSVSNVLREAGIENICRWLPFEASRARIKESLRNKMIRPTTIPEELSDLLVEQAVAREALRLAFRHHRMLAVGLKGVQKERTIAEFFSQEGPGGSLIDMMNIGMIIGSGGVLSHAPDRRAAALMLLDAFEPCGVTELAVDSIFMMPHLGVFSQVHEKAALEIFERDCLVPLGTSLCPVYRRLKPGTPVLEFDLGGRGQAGILKAGELLRFELKPGEESTVRLSPCHRQVDIGAGPGRPLETRARGGHAGILLDGRGRPLAFEVDPAGQVMANRRAMEAFGLQEP